MKKRVFAAVLAVCCPVLADVLWTNGEWEFRRTDRKEDWRTVAVPHDWAIAGPFDPDVDGGSGKLPWKGKGEYRRDFALKGLAASRAGGEKFYLEFDGVMARPKVFVNGSLAGGWDYGYMSFTLDVTEFLREGTNSVKVACDTTLHSSRWYPGAGLYREVRFVRRPADHVIPGTLSITTPSVTKASATVHVAYDSPVKGHVEFDRVIAKPRLWDVDDPWLYELEIGGERFRYGIRTFEFTADDGFHLNGRRVQLKGVDLHSDMGPLGMAFDRDVMKRQLLIMKDMGVNALRTSHNAPDPKVLELCDEMGIFVWDECFDKWDGTSGRDFNAENLETYVARNLRQFVRRDRNHPSVFVWSIGNEICPDGHGWNGPDPNMRHGMNAERFREFRTAIRELDATRPVGIGCCHGYAVESGMFAELDITGWNYKAQYRNVKRKHPEKPVLYSESASALSDYGYYGEGPAKHKTDYDFKRWKVCGWDHCSAGWSDIPDVEFDRMETDRYCCGEFVWTGIDYLGEPSPLWKGGSQGVPKDTPYSQLARSSYFGIVDLAGVPKDRYYIYRSHWNGADETVHVVPHWNLQAGVKTPVYVYTSGDEAELFLNGRSLGRKAKDGDPGYVNFAGAATASASSEQRGGGDGHPAADALKTDRTSRWCAANASSNQWWQADFGNKTAFASVSVQFEQEQRKYGYRIMLSDDGGEWAEYFAKKLGEEGGVIRRPGSARYLKVVFDGLAEGAWASIRNLVVADRIIDDPYYDVCAKYRIRWYDIPYEPGELKAVAYKGGRKIGEAVVKTAEKPVAVRLTDDPYNAPGAKTRFVQVDLVDAAGTRDPQATDRVTFKVDGPGFLAAVGNGDPRCHEAFIGTDSYPLFYGKGVAVVRRTGEGRLTLTASSGSLKPAVIELE